MVYIHIHDKIRQPRYIKYYLNEKHVLYLPTLEYSQHACATRFSSRESALSILGDLQGRVMQLTQSIKARIV